MRVCKKCDIEQPLDQFRVFRNGKRSGRRYECNSCRKLYEDRWRSDHVEHLRRYRAKRDYNFDLPVGGYPSNCELCGKEGRICLDHDHETRRVRGFLCNSCNTAIGYAQDDANLLRKMADYLEKEGA